MFPLVIESKAVDPGTIRTKDVHLAPSAGLACAPNSHLRRDAGVWVDDTNSQPSLGLLCASARHVFLRASPALPSLAAGDCTCDRNRG